MDYRGEIGVILINLSNEPFEIKPGERIAQLVIAKYEQISWEQVEVLDETERGIGGYGHTGVKWLYKKLKKIICNKFKTIIVNISF